MTRRAVRGIAEPGASARRLIKAALSTENDRHEQPRDIHRFGSDSSSFFAGLLGSPYSVAHFAKYS